ncbi:MAG: hypothetical protein KC996_10125 [Phycisphaerales bacterium]|nr:hypothetical protein [Phycisphaerales bacterium]
MIDLLSHLVLAQMLGREFASPMDAPPSGAPPITTGFFLVVMLLVLVALLVMAIGMWKVFSKAGHPGWAAFIPILNLYFLCKTAGRPGWWLILLFIPLVQFVIFIVLIFDLAKVFGKGLGFALGLLFFGFIFFPILGLGKSEYRNPVAI